MAPRALLPLALLAPLLLAAPAFGQEVAAAEALFNKGVAEMDAGRFDSACPALAESQRLDPRPGTQFALAECNAKAGKIATAAALYEDYLRLVASQPAAVKAKHGDRLRIARAQIDKLKTAVPTLTLVLPHGAPGDARVRRDGTELSAAALGLALPIDPGAHVVSVEVTGRAPSEQRFTVERGQQKTVELTLGTAPAPGAAAPAAAGPVSAAPPVDAPEHAAATPGQGQRVGAFVAGGVGAASLLMGAITGGLVLAKKSVVDANCHGVHCNHAGKLAADAAQPLGLVSTIGFVVGVAGLGTGTALFLTAPKKTDEKAARYDVVVGPGGLALHVKGVF